VSTHPSETAFEPSSILLKAFNLLRAFRPDRRTMSLTEIARASGLPKSTVHRLIERLLELDAIERTADGYSVSLGFGQLGAITPAAGGRDAALPYLAWLHRGTGHTIHYAVLRELQVVYLEKLARRHSSAAPSAIGARLPANCTAIGKALLSWEDPARLDGLLRRAPLPALTPNSITDPDVLIDQLRHVHADGLARERDEAGPGVSCVGAPIVVNGYAVGAISVSYSTTTPLEPQVEDAVRVAATRISRDFRSGLKDGRERWFPFDLE
jgi:DNA-binding IclR family transcriptional regulator